MENKIRSALKEYTSIGWVVLPVYVKQDHHGKKLPLFGAGYSWNENYKEDSWEDRLKALGENANGVIVLTGQISNLLVLDVDLKCQCNGFESLKKAEIVLPQAPKARTQSGGLHVFFSYPESFTDKQKTTVSNLLPGVDTRGNGGFIFLPPTVVKGGREYKWEKNPFDCSIPEANETLLKLFEKRTGPSKHRPGWRKLFQLSPMQKRYLDSYLNRAKTALVGNRSDSDFALVGWAVKCQLARGEIEKICNFGKFKRSDYFDRTYSAALKGDRNS